MSSHAWISLRKFRLPLVTALCIASSLSAIAQTRELHIELDEEACRVVTAVSVVYNYDDTAYRATKTSDCHWKYDMPTFMSTTPFSLRLNGAGRTRCRRATQLNEHAFTLKFSRAATEEDAKDIRITGNALRYVRDVPQKRDGEVACFEVGAVPGTLFDVQFDVEDVRVQLFKDKKVSCGVQVKGLFTLLKSKQSEPLNVTSKEIAQAIERQSVQGTLCHTPSLVPLALIRKSVSDARLTLEVK